VTPQPASLLRIYVNANDRSEGRPMHELLVAAALAEGLAGASVFPAVFGYGARGSIHDLASDYQFEDAPLVIEIVDKPERIDAFVKTAAPLLSGGLLTLEPVQVYGPLCQSGGAP
jgi:PII-like signaling protein